jgi:hypothetical protein
MSNNNTTQSEQFAEMMKNFPEFRTTSKNGYEIRTEVLGMAQNQVWQDYTAKWGAWETTVRKEGDEIITEVKMPEVPGVDTVLEAAQKMYSFVTGNNK